MSNRSKLLVDPTVQWAIARRIICHWVLLVLCLVCIGVMLRLLVSAGRLPFAEAMVAALKAQAPIIGGMVFLLPVFLRDTLKLSNRFAGPMYRLRTALASVANGEETRPIKFRTGDFWQEVAGDFNTVLAQNQTLQARVAELEADLDRQNQLA